MRGSPLIRALLVLIVLATLLVPLRRLTSQQRPLRAQPPLSHSVPKKPLHLELTCTTSPFKYQITNSGQTVWSGSETGATAQTDLNLEFPPEGVDLVMDVAWNEKRPTAVRLVVKPSDDEATSQTAWGTTSVSEVVTVRPSK